MIGHFIKINQLTLLVFLISLFQLVEMGFAKTDVLACLKTFEGDLERSVAYLTENKVAPDEWKQDLPSTSSSKVRVVLIYLFK